EQVALHAIEPIVEGDAMDFADQLILSMRDKLGDDRAEDEQRGNRFHDCNRAGDTDRNDIAITDRGRGYEAEIECARQTLDAGAQRPVRFDEPVPAQHRSQPVAESTEQDRSDPDEKKLQGGQSVDDSGDGVIPPLRAYDPRLAFARKSLGRKAQLRSCGAYARLAPCRLGPWLQGATRLDPIGKTAAVVAHPGVAQFVEQADRLLSQVSGELRAV